MDDDDIPWADPAIRRNYEAALGAFILGFNEVDYRVSRVIELELIARGRSDLARTASRGPFSQRLEYLDLLVCTSGDKELAKFPVAQLRSLNADRNALAHGHFDQNPFDGSYTLVLAAKTRDYPTERILDAIDKLKSIGEMLRGMEAVFSFSDLTATVPQKEA